MKIEKVHLKNIGPHRSLDLDVDAGLVGVIGANGSGKSTFVNSIYAALTNDFSRFGATKSDVIHNECGSEHSFIEITGSHRNQSFSLKRWLKPNKSHLTIGSREYTKANEVNKAIEVQLNIPKAVIEKYVFVNQWDMFGFLDQSKSERAKTLQYLCGSEKASKLADLCSNYVSRVAESAVLDNSVELNEQLLGQQDAVDECVAKLTTERAKLAYPEDLEEALNVLNTKSDCDDALQYAVETTEELKEARSHLKEQKNLYFQVKANRVSLVAELRELEKHPLYWLYDRYTALNVLLKDIAKVKTQLKGLAATKKSTRAEVAELSEGDSDRIDLIPGLQEEVFRLKGLQAHFAEFAAKKFSRGEECPTCRQLVDKHHIEQLSAELDAREAAILQQEAELKELYDLEKRHQRKTDDYASAVASYSKVKEQLAWHKAKLPEGFGQEEMEDLKKLRQQVFATRKNLRDCSKARLTGIKDVIRERRLRITKLQASIAEYQVIADKMPAEADCVRADKFVESWEEAQEAAARHSGSLAALKEARDGTLSLLKSLKAKIAEHASRKDCVGVISKCSDVFHWNGLPRAVSQANLQLLADDINRHLAIFNDPFYVVASDDLTFDVWLPGVSGAVLAKQLSGGQKVILAVAFRLALSEVFGNDVGMLFLDEPTAGLDDDNILKFADALSQLRSGIKEDRQVVVITHVQELASSFDATIRIGTGG